MNPSSSPLRHLWALAAFSTSSATLSAADISWTAASGDFGVATNWQGAVVPGPGDNAFIENGGNVRLSDSRSVLRLHLRTGTLLHQPADASATLTNTVGLWVGQGAGRDATYEINNGLTFATADLAFGTDGGKGRFSFVNGFVSKTGSVPLQVGGGNGGNGTFEQQSGFINCGSPFIIADGAGATGTYQGGATSAVVAGDELVVGNNGGAGHFELTGTVSFTLSSSISPRPVASFGRGAGSTATIDQSGGRFVNNNSITYLGESGNASASWKLSGPISGNGSAEAIFGILEFAHSDTASGTFELAGGTLIAGQITAGDSSGDSKFIFDGGVLRPLNSTGDLMSGLSSAVVKENGAIIDTSSGTGSYDAEIAQDLLDGGGNGGLSKRGAGILILSGACSYTGDTSVQAGSLLINGTLPSSAVFVEPNGTLGGKGTIGSSIGVFGKVLAGDFGGTLTVSGNADIQGSLVASIAGTSSNVLAVAGALDISSATLEVSFDGPPVAGTMVIATYGSLVGGSFAGITGLPSGYTVDYAYQGNKIAITGAPAGYAAWAAGYSWPAEQDSQPEADPDADGVANAIEFMVGADPLQPTPAAALPAGKIVLDPVLQTRRFHFTFRRDEAALTVPPVVQFGPDLQTWTDASDGVAGVSVSTDADGDDELWTVSIPMPANGSPLFARLKVTIP